MGKGDPMRQLADSLPRRSWRARKRTRLWFREYRRQLRYAGLAAFAFAVLLELVQLVYPGSRVLPMVEAGGQPIGGRTTAAAQSVLDARYDHAVIEVKTANKTFQRSVISLGGEVDTGDAARRAAAYPLWQRLIPFSSIAIMINRDTPVKADFDNTPLQVFAEQVQKEGYAAAINASLSADGGKVKVVPATPSREYPALGVATAIRQTRFNPKTELTLKPQTKSAALTDKEAEAMRDEVQARIDEKLLLTLQNKETKVDKKIIGSWVTFTPDATANRLDIGLHAEKVKKYLQEVQAPVYKAPGTTHIQLIDDREVSRITGHSGKGIAMDEAIGSIRETLKTEGEDVVMLTVTDLPPVIAYDKKYSNTDKELAALVSGLAAKGYGISLMELDGRSAFANGSKQFVAASTYKLYVAYAVFEEVKAGRLSWTDMVGSRTVAKCFDDMIIVSDNECPKALGNRIGWTKITSMMHNLGLSSATRLGSAMYTTATDLSYFLYRIQNGSIVSSTDKERLISAMKRQSYTRAGIPSGAGGTVADKVGDVDGYLHDAAIVYGPKKTYVLVVMTYAGSWAGIADVARQVDAYIQE